MCTVRKSAAYVERHAVGTLSATDCKQPEMQPLFKWDASKDDAAY